MPSKLSRHNKEDDGWIAINNEVWDVTGFADVHPGGSDAILDQLGKDASSVYNGGHSLGLLRKMLGPEKRMGTLDGNNTTVAELVASLPGAKKLEKSRL